MEAAEDADAIKFAPWTHFRACCECFNVQRRQCACVWTPPRPPPPTKHQSGAAVTHAVIHVGKPTVHLRRSTATTRGVSDRAVVHGAGAAADALPS